MLLKTYFYVACVKKVVMRVGLIFIDLLTISCTVHFRATALHRPVDLRVLFAVRSDYLHGASLHTEANFCTHCSLLHSKMRRAFIPVIVLVFGIEPKHKN